MIFTVQSICIFIKLQSCENIFGPFLKSSVFAFFVFHAEWLQIFTQNLMLYKENLNEHAIQSLNCNFI